jgi:hypothetical protein
MVVAGVAALRRKPPHRAGSSGHDAETRETVFTDVDLRFTDVDLRFADADLRFG